MLPNNDYSSSQAFSTQSHECDELDASTYDGPVAVAAEKSRTWGDFLFAWWKKDDSELEKQWQITYSHFYRSLYLKNKTSTSWLELQSNNGNDQAKAYCMVILTAQDDDRTIPRRLASEIRESLASWQRSTNDTVLMHAEYIMGHQYDYGLASNQINFIAVEWYKKSSDKGHAEAQNRLAFCHYYGLGFDPDHPDLEQAFSLYLSAANLNHMWAQCSVAYCYLNGKGVARNREEAVAWFLRSAKQGYEVANKALRDLES